MKTKPLIDAINLFYKKASIKKEANLLSDMARRVMFSLIPGQRFDFIAARWAANGIINSVTYGTRAIREELNYYRGDFPVFENKQLRAYGDINLGKFGKNTITKYRDFLEIAWLMFDDAGNWETSFGGKSWRNIAETMLHLVNLYDKFLQTEKYTNAEEDVLKQIIIYLNVFDGLAHNTGGIFEKMVGEEEAIHNDDFYNNLEQLLKIRDMTELPESIHVFKEIEPLLYPKTVYQDYITEIRSNPKYFKSENPEQQLKNIKAIKKLKQTGKYHIKNLRSRLGIIIDHSNGMNNSIYALQKYVASYNSASSYPGFYPTVVYIFESVPAAVHNIYYYISQGVDNNSFELPDDINKNDLVNLLDEIAKKHKILHKLELARNASPQIKQDLLYGYTFSVESIKELLKLNLVQRANAVKNTVSESIPLLEKFCNLYEELLEKYV